MALKAINESCTLDTVAQKTVQVFACFRKIVFVQNADIIQGPDFLVTKNITY